MNIIHHLVSSSQEGEEAFRKYLRSLNCTHILIRQDLFHQFVQDHYSAEQLKKLYTCLSRTTTRIFRDPYCEVIQLQWWKCNDKENTQAVWWKRRLCLHKDYNHLAWMIRVMAERTLCGENHRFLRGWILSVWMKKIDFREWSCLISEWKHFAKIISSIFWILKWLKMKWMFLKRRDWEEKGNMDCLIQACNGWWCWGVACPLLKYKNHKCEIGEGKYE